MKKFLTACMSLAMVFLAQQSFAQEGEQVPGDSKANLNLDLLFSPDPLLGIDLDYEDSEEFVHFCILDQEGHILIEQDKSSKQKPDFSELTPGVYFLEIYDRDRKLSFRFEKKISGDKAS